MNVTKAIIFTIVAAATITFIIRCMVNPQSLRNDWNNGQRFWALCCGTAYGAAISTLAIGVVLVWCSFLNG